MDLFWEELVRNLESFEMKGNYSDEQRDLQPHLLKIVEGLIHTGQFDGYSAIVSVGGDKKTKKPKVDLYGTNFWTDIEILFHNKPVIGIEAKIVKKGKSASKSIAESIGQSFIYKSKYERVIDFIINDGISNDKYNEYDEAFNEMCSKNNIKIIMRKNA